MKDLTVQFYALLFSYFSVKCLIVEFAFNFFFQFLIKSFQGGIFNKRGGLQKKNVECFKNSSFDVLISRFSFYENDLNLNKRNLQLFKKESVQTNCFNT